MAEPARIEIPAGPSLVAGQGYRSLYHEVVVLDAADTRQQAPASGDVTNLYLVADSQNDGEIYWGGDAVTKGGGAKPGFPLSPGDSSGPWNLRQVSEIWVIGANPGDTLVLTGLQG